MVVEGELVGVEVMVLLLLVGVEINLLRRWLGGGGGGLAELLLLVVDSVGLDGLSLGLEW